jgi:hypothetical protein
MKQSDNVDVRTEGCEDCINLQLYEVLQIYMQELIWVVGFQKKQ